MKLIWFNKPLQKEKGFGQFLNITEGQKSYLVIKKMFECHFESNVLTFGSLIK